MSVYLLFTGSPEEFDSVLDDLASVIESKEAGLKCVICGNLNGDLGLRGPTWGKNPNRLGGKIYDFIQRYEMIAVK